VAPALAPEELLQAVNAEIITQLIGHFIANLLRLTPEGTAQSDRQTAHAGSHRR
jgi:hypothetical protein